MSKTYRLIDETKFQELIAGYVKNTDIATADTLGLIRLNDSECGLQIVGGRLNGKSVSASAYKSATNTGLVVTKKTLDDLLDADYFTGEDLLMIGPIWDSSNSYKNGDLVIHERGLYKANKSIDAGTAWSDTDWDATTVTDSVAKVSAGSVTEESIVDGSVTTDKIADDAVTEEKLSDDLADKINNAQFEFSNESFTVAVGASATVRDQEHTITKTGYTPVFSVVTTGTWGDYVRWGQTHTLSDGSAVVAVSVANTQSTSITVSFRHWVVWKKD